MIGLRSDQKRCSLGRFRKIDMKIGADDSLQGISLKLISSLNPFNLLGWQPRSGQNDVDLSSEFKIQEENISGEKFYPL